MKKKILLSICSLFILLEVKANTSTAINSGAWTTAATWQSNSVPVAGDSIVIAAGVSVTFSANTFLSFPYFKILGTLTVTGSQMKFGYPINIDIESGGTFHDATTPYQFMVFKYYANLKGDTINIFSGGQFICDTDSTFIYSAPDNVSVKDSVKFTGTIAGSYHIWIDPADGKIHYGATLPVSLYNFSGQYQDGAVSLKWSTASEQNNDHFELQRSLDGNLFAAIANIAGAGTSSQQHDYSYTDGGVTKMGTNQLFYRLKQVDIDGRFTFYKMIRVLLKNDIAATLKLWPNPNSGQFVLQLGQAPKQPVTIKIFDAQGRLVLQQESQQQQININLSGKGKGMYFIQLHSADGGKKVLSALVQ